MYASTSFTSVLIHDLLSDTPSRKLLLQNPIQESANTSPYSSMDSHNSTKIFLGDRDFEANVVMIISVLLCALVFSLGLNSIIRCVLRCSNIVIDSDDSSSASYNNNNNPSPQLANKGIKKKALRTFPTVNYSTELKLPGLDTECVICLSEFNDGDEVRILPKCHHGFHVRCIDKWLSCHSSCPKCRHCLLETCKKIVVSQSQVQPVVPLPEIAIRIEPLAPEGLERNYREVINTT